MRRAAIVYVIEDQLLIASAPMTTAGLDTMLGLTTISWEAGPEALGASIQQALVACEEMVPPSTEAEWKASYDALLAATGIADLRAFMLAATMFYVVVEGEGPVIVEGVEKPSQNNIIELPQGEDGFLGSDIGVAMAVGIERLLAGKDTTAWS